MAGTSYFFQSLSGLSTSVAKGTLIAMMPHVPLANYAYRNNGDVTFTDMAGPRLLPSPIKTRLIFVPWP